MLKKLLKTIKNPYVFSVISESFGIIVAFLFTIFQARFLGAEIKGKVTTVNSIVGITSIVLGLGINQAYPYFRKRNSDSVIPLFMKISLLMLAVYGAISVAVVSALDLDLKYVGVFLITPLMVYDGIVSEIILVEIPNKRNATIVIANISELLFVIVLWLTAKPTLFLGIVILVFKNIIKSTIFTYWLRDRFFVKTDNLLGWIKELTRFGFFPMLAVLMSTLNYRVDVLMLNGHVSDAAIGVYSIGALLADRMWMIPDAMKGVMVSNLAKGKGSREAAYVIRICNTICVFIVLGIVILGNQFINFVFGTEYEGAYPITLILLIGVFPMINYKVIAAYNNVIGKQKVSFFMLSISVLLNIIANYFLIPSYGIYGAGVASVVSYLVCSILFVSYFCKDTELKYTEMIIINKNDISRLLSRIKEKNSY